ncbi:hypothetical protein SEVIR_2G291150v4 [Setaria viridis]
MRRTPGDRPYPAAACKDQPCGCGRRRKHSQARPPAGSPCVFGAVRPCPQRNRTRACGRGSRRACACLAGVWSGVGPWCVVAWWGRGDQLKGTMHRRRASMHELMVRACGRGVFWANGATTAAGAPTDRCAVGRWADKCTRGSIELAPPTPRPVELRRATGQGREGSAHGTQKISCCQCRRGLTRPSPQGRASPAYSLRRETARATRHQTHARAAPLPACMRPYSCCCWSGLQSFDTLE